MNRPLHLFACAFALTCCAAAGVRADTILWDYSWTMSSATGNNVFADVGGPGHVHFGLEQSPGQGSGPVSDIGAVNLTTVTKTPATNPAQFVNNGSYTLTLTLTDVTSNLTGSVTFAGKLSGSFSAANADVENTFIGPTTKGLDLGANHYDITIDGYTPPPSPGAGKGHIGAHVVVSDLHIKSVPEPSTLILSCLGGFALVGTSLRRLRRRLRPV